MGSCCGDAHVKMVDGTIVRAHQHATCIGHDTYEGLGPVRGGSTTKINAVVDTNGFPIKLALAPDHQPDSLNAPDLLSEGPEGGLLLADKSYDPDFIGSLVTAKGG